MKEKEALWKKNVIKYPNEGELIPAGPIHLEWGSGGDIGKILGYEILFDGVTAGIIFATAEETLTYELYTTQVSKHTIEICAVCEDKKRITCDVRTFYVSKKGIGLREWSNHKQLEVCWYYNWSTTETKDMKLDFIPMIWGNEKNVWNSKKDWTKYHSLMGFQEPDFQTQSNISVEEAVDLWQEFQTTGLRLGSPATAIPAVYTNTSYLHESSKGWFYRFMEAVGDTVDYIAVHDYDDSCSAEDFLRMVDKTWETWHKPIWITEFGVACWNEEKGGWDAAKKNQVYEFMKYVLPELDKREFVERYAWYPFDENDEWGGASAIFDYATGEPNELGKLYAKSGLPADY